MIIDLQQFNYVLQIDKDGLNFKFSKCCNQVETSPQK